MAQNLQIDPKTRDYVMVNGSPVPSDRIFEKAYIALMIPQNKWLYGQVGQGSFLYLLQNQKNSPSTAQSYAAWASDAINRQLIQTGDVSAVQVKNTQSTPSGTANEIDVVPSNTQLSQQFLFTPV